MKKSLCTLLIALLVIACSVDIASAQNQRGQRGGPGMGRDSSQGDSISDSFVLNTERAAKVTAIYAEQQTSMREMFQSGDMQNKSREEMMTAFREMREKMNTAITEKLATVLTKEEMEFLQPLLNTRGGRTDAEIRALRQIEMTDETRGKLQTLVLIYQNTLIALRPERTPEQQGQRGQRGQRGGVSEEVRTKMEAAKETLVVDIKKVLSDDQVTAWATKTAEVQKEMEAQRGQRGQRGQRSGQGQGGQRSQRGGQGQGGQRPQR